MRTHLYNNKVLGGTKALLSLLPLCLFTVSMLLTACSNISEDERFVYVKPADVKRRVLIEDFTGQRCVNCPAAHEEIERLQQQYGESNVIAVSIHGGALSVKSTATIVGLWTELGDQYNKSAGVESWPAGLINRAGGLLDVPQWAAKVYEEVQKTTPVSGIEFVNVVKGDRLSFDVNVSSLEDLFCKLQLWIVEDGIVAPQQMGDGSMNRNYVHNNVFRGTITDFAGDDLALLAGKTTQVSYSMAFNEEWNRENLAILAIVSNKNGVLQVAKIKLKDL